MEWLNNVGEFYKFCLSIGLMPLAPVFVIITTHFIKQLKFFQDGKEIKTIITALIIGIIYTAIFLQFAGMLKTQYYFVNLIFNILASVATPNITDIIINHFSKKKNDDVINKIN